MELSVVVPTLNARDQLAGCLDALAEHVPDAEVVVVNGPSTDGTSGMVRDRPDVDVLVEVADRSLSVARNAGIDRAGGDAIALIDQELTVESGWRGAVLDGLDGADVVTGPTHRRQRAGMATETVESRTVAGREVTFFNGGNAAFDREALDATDGFDEYCEVGAERDLAHRLAGLDMSVDWTTDMCVRREIESDGGVTPTDWRWRYRSMAYRLVKNYGPRPTVLGRLGGSSVRDAVSALVEVVRGDAQPSSWFGNGRDVTAGIVRGTVDGIRARLRDRSPRRNPWGRSSRADRAVAVYDRRD